MPKSTEQDAPLTVSVDRADPDFIFRYFLEVARGRGGMCVFDTATGSFGSIVAVAKSRPLSCSFASTRTGARRLWQGALPYPRRP
jgi:hypothetical protein